jgi:NTP pyrophosphatase (non-canonical NTP hydrolase)
MNLTNEFQSIRDWAKEKGILDKGDSKTQTVKMAEEFGEFAGALLRNNKPEIKDAIGDMVVVLTSLAYHNGFTIEECINSAYDIIAKRNGSMIDGNFVKHSEKPKFPDNNNLFY